MKAALPRSHYMGTAKSTRTYRFAIVSTINTVLRDCENRDGTYNSPPVLSKLTTVLPNQPGTPEPL